jgi:hypothetical protein
VCPIPDRASTFAVFVGHPTSPNLEGGFFLCGGSLRPAGKERLGFGTEAAVHLGVDRCGAGTGLRDTRDRKAEHDQK